MKNQIKDTDVLAFVDDLREELGLYMLSVYSIGDLQTSFSAITEMFCDSIVASTIAELKQKLAENTPEARLAKEIADTEAKLAKLKEKQGGGNE